MSIEYSLNKIMPKTRPWGCPHQHRPLERTHIAGNSMTAQTHSCFLFRCRIFLSEGNNFSDVWQTNNTIAGSGRTAHYWDHSRVQYELMPRHGQANCGIKNCWLMQSNMQPGPVYWSEFQFERMFKFFISSKSKILMRNLLPTYMDFPILLLLLFNTNIVLNLKLYWCMYY